jgi:flagellar motility protein MotE (MotC chaperone)
MRRLTGKFLRAIRLLPVLVVASVLLLTVRAGEFTGGFEFGGTTVALAETKSEAHADSAPAPAARAPEPEEDDSFDPVTRFTDEELELLQDLAKRRQELIVREDEIDSRNRLLDAAEARIDTRITELQDIRSAIEALVRQYDKQEQAELESVVKIYETMKPKDAARILGELELTTLLGIMERMNTRKTAPILAAMQPERAREVTEELARRKTVDLSSPRAVGG